MKELERLDGLLESEAFQHGIVGASAAVYCAGQIHAASVGKLASDRDDVCTIETRFPIGCIMKALTGTLIFQLADEGKLALERPIVDYLPDFAVSDQRFTRQITPMQLLLHTSGIDERWLVRAGSDGDRFRRFVAEIASFGHLHPPGALFSYGHAGYVVLAEAAAAVTGLPFLESLERRLLTPLGIAPLLDQQAAPVASEHTPHPKSGRQVPRTFNYPRYHEPAGSGEFKMSMPDLIRFAQLFLPASRTERSRQILSDSALATMRRATIPKYFHGERQGVGCNILPSGLVQMLGVNFGSFSSLRLLPEHDAAIAMATNTLAKENELLPKVPAEMLNAIARYEVLDPDPGATLMPEIPLSAAERRALCGRYERNQYAVEIFDAGDVLKGRTDYALFGTRRTDDFTLVRQGEREFRAVAETKLTFGLERVCFLTLGAAPQPTHFAAEEYVFRRTPA